MMKATLVKASIVEPKQIKALEKIRLLQIFLRTRDISQTDFEAFFKRQHRFILLREPRRGKLVGFISLLRVRVPLKGRLVRGLVTEHVALPADGVSVRQAGRALLRMLLWDRVQGFFRKNYWFTFADNRSAVQDLVRYLEKQGARVRTIDSSLALEGERLCLAQIELLPPLMAQVRS